MKTICPVCEDFRDVEVLTTVEETSVKGETISAEAVYSKCKSCSEEFSTPEQMAASLENAYRIYRNNHRLIHPEEIVAIRSKYRISQKAFAKILGFGELTINSYEKGTLPVKASSNLIKLMEETDAFLKLYEINRDEITPTQQRKIETRLDELALDDKEWENEVEAVTRFVERRTTRHIKAEAKTGMAKQKGSERRAPGAKRSEKSFAIKKNALETNRHLLDAVSKNLDLKLTEE